jgi:glutamine---fructose-6-phosphate transaminase (isomerizing)
MADMLQEIRQQPETLTRILDHSLEAIRALRERFRAVRPRLVVIAARGTSDNAAQFGRYLIEIATGIPVSLAAPSVYTLYRSDLDLHDVLVVGISQSGESTDINAVVADAREGGAVTVGITNEPQSALAQTAEFVLPVCAGKEQSIAATKTYTGQLLVLYRVAVALGGPVDPDDLRRIPEWVAATLRLENRIADLTERYRFMTGTVTVGRGLNYANALEFGLKLMETCYVLAERFSAADLLHGPIALIERGFPVFVFAPPGPTWPSISAVLARLTELRADTLVIASRDTPQACAHARVIAVPCDLPDLYTPIPYIIPAQLFAAHLAEVRGLDPDHPRTLTKVTRTL